MSNYSVLPWYKHIDGQDFRRWWKYGRIYPLFSRPDSILPSFFYRDGHETGNVYTWEDTINLAEIGFYFPNTVLQGWNAVPGDGCSMAIGINALYSYGLEYLCIIGAVKSPLGHAWAVVDGDDDVVLYGDSDIVGLPLQNYQGCTLYIQLAVGASVEEQDEIDSIPHPRLDLASGYSDGALAPIITELYTPDGKFVKDIWRDGLWSVNGDGDNDLIYPVIGVNLGMPEGQYYIKVSDGVNTWYSDVFTVVSDDALPDFIRLEWWNDSELVMDSGFILPSVTDIGSPNVLYLKADIAKPEYRYDEDGETRDGRFYPTKQISTKVYRFSFMAVEYLLDVLRLIPLADHILLTTNANLDTEREYKPEQILLTPTWESEGDVAAVAVEFETDTIAKKLGLAYIRG